jgi:hypothetical protein
MKIKWNWGTKLVIAMAAFMIMVLSFVVVMFQQDINLVEKDYYPKGQAHQELIVKIRQTMPYANDILASFENEEISVVFPAFFRPESTKGTVHLYHRIDDAHDRFSDLVLNENGIFTYPASHLSGRYILKISWHQDDTEYYTEKNVTIE